MKKVILSTLALLMLCGCGKKATKTVCKGSLEGQDVSITLNFDKNEAITGLEMSVKVDAGSKETAELMKGVLESKKETLLSGFDGNGEAVFKIDGTAVVVNIVVDVSKITEFSGVDVDGTKDEIIEAFETAGLKCK